MTNVILAGIEFHTADLLPVFILLGLVFLGHLVALPLVIWGHVKLYRSRRPAHLVYVLPLSWYFISLASFIVGYHCQDRWSYRAWSDDSTAQYVIAMLIVVLLALHGLWVARLMQRADGPALCRWVLASAGLLLLAPPLGVVLAVVAVHRIRRSEGRLFGLGGAWVSLAANLAVSLLFLVATVNQWPGWFGRNSSPAYVGTNLAWSSMSGPAYYQSSGLSLAFNESRTRATGRAVFCANPEERHYYKVELRQQR